MKTTLRMLFLLALLAPIVLATASHAIEVTAEDARTVAENYVEFTLAKEGTWGVHETARVTGIEPFLRGERLLGYYCPVEPEGYFILGRYRDLAPIRFYSVRGSLDPRMDTGMADMLKVQAEMLYDAITQSLGHAIEPEEDFRAILPVAYGDAWEILGDPEYVPVVTREIPKTRSAGMDYQPGETLITTGWHQQPPYNNECPWYGCDWSAYNDFNSNALVGCVGVAGAQILKYYNWPPFGRGSGWDDPYDWPNICDRYDWDSTSGWFEVTEEGVESPATWDQINAVAELNFEFSVAAATDFGCDASSVNGTDDICYAFRGPFFCWDGVEAIWRSDATFAVWWARMKEEFNLNRPVMYLIPHHAIVGDGWKEEWIDHPHYGLHYEWMHVNFGWGGGNDGWCPPSEIPGGDVSEEGFVRKIVPNTAIGDLIGDYDLPSAGPYRYFQLDSTGYDANVTAGHRLQVLRSGFLLTHLYGGGPIFFNGDPGNDTLFFIDGDTIGESRIRINDGQIKMVNGGQLALY